MFVFYTIIYPNATSHKYAVIPRLCVISKCVCRHVKYINALYYIISNIYVYTNAYLIDEYMHVI